MTVSNLVVCGGLVRGDFLPFATLVVCGGHERMHFFYHLLLWECVVVFKELIFDIFWSGGVWWSWKNLFLTVSNLGVCGGLERADFLPFATLGVCGGHERTNFLPFATLGVCGGHERTDF